MRGPKTILILGALLCLFAAACGATTNNYVTFEKQSVQLMEGLKSVKLEPGNAGDRSGGTGAGANLAGGDGKQSPGGSNMIDGWGSVQFIIQVGGETPAKIAPTTSLAPAVTANSPGSTTTGGGGAGGSGGETGGAGGAPSGGDAGGGSGG